ncbi:MAG: elongation factor Ts [Candidatus Daviesbacteria bacterium]|nr:elongation factor Ts [Candidatus Daviesbacteria bacterium]
MAVNISDLKKLRTETGASIADVRQALEESGGDLKGAREKIVQKGLDKATSKESREVKAGLVESYVHAGKVGVLVEVLCETDFVAKTDEFKTLAHELALQIASMNPENKEELLNQEYIRDPGQKIDNLIKTAIAKLGENIQIGKFARISLGE